MQDNFQTIKTVDLEKLLDEIGNDARHLFKNGVRVRGGALPESLWGGRGENR